MKFGRFEIKVLKTADGTGIVRVLDLDTLVYKNWKMSKDMSDDDMLREGYRFVVETLTNWD